MDGFLRYRIGGPIFGGAYFRNFTVINLCTKRIVPGEWFHLRGCPMQGTILSTDSKVLYKQNKQYPHECGGGEVSCKTVIKL